MSRPINIMFTHIVPHCRISLWWASNAYCWKYLLDVILFIISNRLNTWDRQFEVGTTMKPTCHFSNWQAKVTPFRMEHLPSFFRFFPSIFFFPPLFSNCFLFKHYFLYIYFCNLSFLNWQHCMLPREYGTEAWLEFNTFHAKTRRFISLISRTFDLCSWHFCSS